MILGATVQKLWMKFLGRVWLGRACARVLFSGCKIQRENLWLVVGCKYTNHKFSHCILQLEKRTLACARANQQELTTCTNSGGQEKKKFKKKRADWPCPGVNPRSPAGCGLTPGQGQTVEIFLVFKSFLKLAPTLGSVKSCKLHGDWRFHFFSNFIFPKFRAHLDLHIYNSDFRFMKD
jgi:hypothetical protein